MLIKSNKKNSRRRASLRRQGPRRDRRAETSPARTPQAPPPTSPLEPCSHTGRTGPCADALIAAKVKKVVIATQDPNPKVSGEGIARLRHAGIEVELGLCEREARTLNDAFAKFIRTGTPFVTLKSALSVDGRLAPAAAHPAPLNNRTGSPAPPPAPKPSSSATHSDAILTGIGTVLADDPALTDRTGLPRRRPLLRVVLDSALATPARLAARDERRQ